MELWLIQGDFRQQSLLRSTLHHGGLSSDVDSVCVCNQSLSRCVHPNGPRQRPGFRVPALQSFRKAMWSPTTMVRSPVPSCPQNCQKKKTKKKRKENNKGKKQRKRQDFPAGEPQPLSPKPTPSPTIPACSADSITHFSTLLPRSLLLYSYPPPSTSEVAGCRLAGGAGAGDELDSMLLTFSLTNAYKHRLHPPYTKHTCMLAIRHRLSPACHPTLLQTQRQ